MSDRNSFGRLASLLAGLAALGGCVQDVPSRHAVCTELSTGKQYPAYAVLYADDNNLAAWKLADANGYTFEIEAKEAREKWDCRIAQPSVASPKRGPIE